MIPKKKTPSKLSKLSNELLNLKFAVEHYIRMHASFSDIPENFDIVKARENAKEALRDRGQGISPKQFSEIREIVLQAYKKSGKYNDNMGEIETLVDAAISVAQEPVTVQELKSLPPTPQRPSPKDGVTKGGGRRKKVTTAVKTTSPT